MSLKRLFLLSVAAIAAMGGVGISRGADFGQPDLTLLDVRPVPLVEGANDVNVARLSSRILQQSHYVRKPFDNEVSSAFLDRYLDLVDGLHLYFIQEDIDEFEKYRHRLDELTMEKGDTTPARIIFNRFRDRNEQQFQYLMKLLSEEKFEFTGSDRYMPNRRDEPRPKDLDDAKRLWRDRLRYEYLQEKLGGDDHETIVETITLRYTRIVRRVREYDNDDVLQMYLTSLSHVYDPHTDYFGPAELENFSIGMKLSLHGIGALLRSEDGYCKIQSLIAEGPAERSKELSPNDRIVAVAQGSEEPVDVVDTPLRKVVELIRGPKGSEVRLTVVPEAGGESARKVVTLIRDTIKLEDQAAKARIMDLPNGSGEPVRLGLIDLPSFYATFNIGEDGGKEEKKSTTEDVAKLLRKLKKEKVQGIILDLRRNGGGSLEEAISLTGLFIKDGTVVQVKDSGGMIYREDDTDRSVLYDGPLVVLTSRFSASASEILAGALQDTGRALLVGDTSTHGKGTVQSLIQLAPIMRSHGLPAEPDPGALKITIRKFYRPSGYSTQLKGVIPDMVLPSVNNHADVGEASLKNPLPWDTIPAGEIEKLDRVAPHLAELTRRSNLRVANDRDFDYVRSQIERYKKDLEDKTVSLNEEQRVKEKKEADERIEARKKELRARETPAGDVYEITLNLAEADGLPETLKAIEEKKKKAAAEEEASKPKKTETDADKEKDKDKGGEGADEEEEEEGLPTVDITLDETQRILMDFIELQSKRKALVAVDADKK